MKSKLAQFKDDAAVWFLTQALSRNNGNQRATARDLGLDHRYFCDQMRKYGIKVERPRPVVTAPDLVLGAEFRRFLGARAPQ